MKLITRDGVTLVGRQDRPRSRSRGARRPADNLVVFDDVIVGTSNVYTSAEFHGVLGSGERLAIQAIADEVAASSGTPTLTVQVEHSPNAQNWLNKNDTAEINATSISTGQVTEAFGVDAGARPGFALARLRIALAGTSPKAHVKVWVTLRDLP